MCVRWKSTWSTLESASIVSSLYLRPGTDLVHIIPTGEDRGHRMLASSRLLGLAMEVAEPCDDRLTVMQEDDHGRLGISSLEDSKRVIRSSHYATADDRKGKDKARDYVIFAARGSQRCRIARLRALSCRPYICGWLRCWGQGAQAACTQVKCGIAPRGLPTRRFVFQ
ncbi:hypothetical protein MRB53_037031 [Persea americana]|nr:hypothetical protein MRB53_037031 [Persea americana]